MGRERSRSRRRHLSKCCEEGRVTKNIIEIMLSRKTQTKIMKVMVVFMVFATVLFLIGPAIGSF
jgi:hypothetical protein